VHFQPDAVGAPWTARVRATSLEVFAGSDPDGAGALGVVVYGPTAEARSAQETVAAALALLKAARFGWTPSYNAIHFNCEHMAVACRLGPRRAASAQVDLCLDVALALERAWAAWTASARLVVPKRNPKAACKFDDGAAHVWNVGEGLALEPLFAPLLRAAIRWAFSEGGRLSVGAASLPGWLRRSGRTAFLQDVQVVVRPAKGAQATLSLSASLAFEGGASTPAPRAGARVRRGRLQAEVRLRLVRNDVPNFSSAPRVEATWTVDDDASALLGECTETLVGALNGAAAALPWLLPTVLRALEAPVATLARAVAPEDGSGQHAFEQARRAVEFWRGTMRAAADARRKRVEQAQEAARVAAAVAYARARWDSDSRSRRRVDSFGRPDSFDGRGRSVERELARLREELARAHRLVEWNRRKEEAREAEDARRILRFAEFGKT
jgi:hypothetical protein